MPLGSKCSPLIFRSHGESRSKLSVWKNVVCSISRDHFTEKFPNLVQRMPLQIRWHLSIFCSHGQRSRSNCRNLYKCCLLNIFGLLCMKVSKLATVDAPRQEMSLFDFLVTMSRSRSNCFELMLSSQCLKLLLLVS